MAELKGNLPALLEMDGEALYNAGSGGLQPPEFITAGQPVVRFPLAA